MLALFENQILELDNLEKYYINQMYKFSGVLNLNERKFFRTYEFSRIKDKSIS